MGVYQGSRALGIRQGWREGQGLKPCNSATEDEMEDSQLASEGVRGFVREGGTGLLSIRLGCPEGAKEGGMCRGEGLEAMLQPSYVSSTSLVTLSSSSSSSLLAYTCTQQDKRHLIIFFPLIHVSCSSLTLILNNFFFSPGLVLSFHFVHSQEYIV